MGHPARSGGVGRDVRDERAGAGQTGRITLNEVAVAARVSRAAASLALRGTPGVAELTRRRILDVAAELGYPAFALIQRRTW